MPAQPSLFKNVSHTQIPGVHVVNFLNFPGL